MHIGHDRGGIGNDTIIVDMHDPTSARPSAKRDDAFDVALYELEHLPPDETRIERRVIASAAQGERHLRDRGKRLNGIAMGHDKSRRGMNGKNGIHGEDMIGIFYGPARPPHVPLK